MKKQLTKRKIKNRKKTSKKKKYSNKRKTIRKLKFIKGGEGDDDDECPICFEKMNSDNEITLSCNHKFHRECMERSCPDYYWIDDPCLCPLCRKPLEPNDINKIFLNRRPIISNRQPLILNRQRIIVPPYETYTLDTVEEFRDWINTKLRGYTREPFQLLLNELNKFLGTDHLPSDLIGAIMEFELEQIQTTTNATLYRYKFTGLVQNIPRIRGNKKYFEFIFDDDGIADDFEIW